MLSEAKSRPVCSVSTISFKPKPKPNQNQNKERERAVRERCSPLSFVLFGGATHVGVLQCSELLDRNADMYTTPLFCSRR